MEPEQDGVCDSCAALSHNSESQRRPKVCFISRKMGELDFLYDYGGMPRGINNMNIASASGKRKLPDVDELSGSANVEGPKTGYPLTTKLYVTNGPPISYQQNAVQRINSEKNLGHETGRVSLATDDFAGTFLNLDEIKGVPKDLLLPTNIGLQELDSIENVQKNMNPKPSPQSGNLNLMSFDNTNDLDISPSPHVSGFDKSPSPTPELYPWTRDMRGLKVSFSQNIRAYEKQGNGRYGEQIGYCGSFGDQRSNQYNEKLAKGKALSTENCKLTDGSSFHDRFSQRPSTQECQNLGQTTLNVGQFLTEEAKELKANIHVEGQTFRNDTTISEHHSVGTNLDLLYFDSASRNGTLATLNRGAYPPSNPVLQNQNLIDLGTDLNHLANAPTTQNTDRGPSTTASQGPVSQSSQIFMDETGQQFVIPHEIASLKSALDVINKLDRTTQTSLKDSLYRLSYNAERRRKIKLKKAGSEVSLLKLSQPPPKSDKVTKLIDKNVAQLLYYEFMGDDKDEDERNSKRKKILKS